MIADDAGGLLIRIQFDQASTVHIVCADPTIGRPDWRATSQMGDVESLIQALPAGPDCLANQRLDLNRAAAHQALAEETMRRCARWAGARYDAERSERELGRQHGHDPYHFRSCVERAQKRSHQLWVLEPGLEGRSTFVEPGTSNRYVYIFVKTDAAAPRRETIRVCSDHFPDPFGFSHAVVGRAAMSAELIDCMRTHGWEILF